MEWLNKNSPFFTLLQESRALFAVELAKNLIVLSVSQGYFRGIGDLMHDPIGLPFKKIAGGNPASFEQLKHVAREKIPYAPVAFVMHPPFPAPRNVRGQAIGGVGAAATLILEREVLPYQDAGEIPLKPESNFASVSHSELFRAYEEMAGLRQCLTSAEERIKAFELEMRFRGMYIKLLSDIAEKARELSSLALILTARIEPSPECRELAEKLEDAGLEISESAMRLARALK